MRIGKFVFVASLSIFLVPAFRSYGGSGDFQPDPYAVQRYGPAYRYPQAGWIVLHVEGEPYERGVQHGRLLHAEIAAHVRCFAQVYSADAPEDAWKLLRMLTEALFLPRFDREYLEEMRGIADGAVAKGAKFDDRPLDLTDIAAVNLWPEIMTMPWAAQAVPTGLEGLKFPEPSVKEPLGEKPSRCSAFAAAGPATSDGKIIFGHITMFMLYPSTFYNVWLDVQPSKGYRVLMQSFPGGIHSGMDYYLNSAGILVSETTIDQTRLDVAGIPLSSRIRKALQYSDSIDEVVEILLAGNNGLYTNEWLLADTKTNEIAMFELGTKTHKLFRSSKNEWFGGTEGFYWGCNNTKDLAVRLETVAATNDRPADMTWRPTDRDMAWIRLYRKHKGKMNADFGREAFTCTPICKASSVDAKFTTTDLAKDLKTWAIFGPPREKTWLPTDEEKRRFREIEPLVSNPWTILHPRPPLAAAPAGAAVELRDRDAEDGFRFQPDEERRRRRNRDATPASVVWRGTLLPKSDGDLWLATAFADYHRIVEREKGLALIAESGCLCADDREKLALDLHTARARYLSAANAFQDTALSRITSDNTNDGWHRIASGKGVLVFSELRRRLGDEHFVRLLDGFGFTHAGQSVSGQDFTTYANQVAGEDLKGFFDYWVNQPGLPTLKLGRVEKRPKSGSGESPGYILEGTLVTENGPMPTNIEVTVETAENENTSIVAVEASTGSFVVESNDPPKRLIVDKYGRVAKANGGAYDVVYPLMEPEQALIVYGTADEEAGNREAAQIMQDRIRAGRTNVTLPIQPDTTVTDEELRGHHLILIGRPTTNRVTERFRSAFPVVFDSQSVAVGTDRYAHDKTSVIAAGVNPLNPRFSVTTVAGLSALATYRAASFLSTSDSGAEVKVIPFAGRPRRLVMPPPELIHEFEGGERVSNVGTD